MLNAVDIFIDAFKQVPWFIPLLTVYILCRYTVFKKH